MGAIVQSLPPNASQDQQIAVQVAGMETFDNKNYFTVGTIENGGNVVRVFTPAGWLPCNGIQDGNTFTGDKSMQPWFYAMRPENRNKAAEACRASGN